MDTALEDHDEDVLLSGSVVSILILMDTALEETPWWHTTTAPFSFNPHSNGYCSGSLFNTFSCVGIIRFQSSF